MHVQKAWVHVVLQGIATRDVKPSTMMAKGLVPLTCALALTAAHPRGNASISNTSALLSAWIAVAMQNVLANSIKVSDIVTRLIWSTIVLVNMFASSSPLHKRPMYG